MTPLYTSPISAKVWNAAPVLAGGQSSTFQTFSRPFISAFGNVSGATTITLMYSQNGVNWYAGPTKVLSGAGNFTLDQTTGAEFLALQSTNAVTITAIISAK